MVIKGVSDQGDDDEWLSHMLPLRCICLSVPCLEPDVWEDLSEGRWSDLQTLGEGCHCQLPLLPPGLPLLPLSPTEVPWLPEREALLAEHIDAAAVGQPAGAGTDRMVGMWWVHGLAAGLAVLLPEVSSLQSQGTHDVTSLWGSGKDAH